MEEKKKTQVDFNSGSREPVGNKGRLCPQAKRRAHLLTTPGGHGALAEKMQRGMIWYSRTLKVGTFLIQAAAGQMSTCRS